MFEWKLTCDERDRFLGVRLTSQEKAMTLLESLKQYTTVVADTGDIEGCLGVRNGRQACAGKHQAKNEFLHGQLPRQRPGIEEARSAVRH